MTKEQKGLAVLDVLMDGRRTMQDLITRTHLPHKSVRHGIEWIRDWAPNALVVERERSTYYYKIPEDALEVAEHINHRAKGLYRTALRLERMTALALEQWPSNQLLKIMHRHLSRMREDVEDLV